MVAAEQIICRLDDSLYITRRDASEKVKVEAARGMSAAEKGVKLTEQKIALYENNRHAISQSEILNDQKAWPARSPDGKINTASMMDMQAWYTANKMSNANFPADRVVDSTYADYAVKKLGPFELENKASTLPGCR